MAKDFLVEIGTEELPPKSLKTLSDEFAAGIQKCLEEQELSFTSVKAFASPRRLAVLVEQLNEQTPRREVAIWGPPAAVAFDAAGNHTKAALAFASKNAVATTNLQVENDGKADKLVYRTTSGGTPAVELLGDMVSSALAALPIAKRMRWGASRNEFVRPVHWVLMLLGSEIVDATVLGLRASRETRGHRFHYNQPLFIDNPGEYVKKLASPGYVLVDFAARREKICQQVEAEATRAGGIAVIDEDLLDEVTALVEWPVALTGKFEERFLSVPAEALISSMKEHQKYFHLVDEKNRLLPCFITVSNIESKDPLQIIDGNERVIRPRLSDATFFFETDKKTPLRAQRERLKSIVFQDQLGSLFDKTERVAQLAKSIAALIGANPEQAGRAAELSKSDLVTNMVGEFADMQGIAGYYYALNDGEEEEIALALNEQYQPRFAGDALPTTATGTLLALADRLDTLVGIFGIGEPPTGSKDPFALRRATLGVLRLLVEKELDLDLRELLSLAQQGYSKLPASDGLVDKVLGYMLERFRAWYEDENISTAVFLAVSARDVSNPLDFNKRVHAVHRFNRMEEAQALAAANKRVSNILAKQAGTDIPALDETLLAEKAEKQLAAQVAEKTRQVAPLLQSRNYTEALEALAGLRASVDQFFDSVMVMTDNASLRNNRLALLTQLRNLFLEVADISLLAPSKG